MNDTVLIERIGSEFRITSRNGRFMQLCPQSEDALRDQLMPRHVGDDQFHRVWQDLARSDSTILEVVLPTPAIKAKTLRPPLLPAAEHDRPGIAQPDIAERFDNDLSERR